MVHIRKHPQSKAVSIYAYSGGARLITAYVIGGYIYFLPITTCTSIIYNLSFMALVIPKIVVVDPCNLGFF